jgi:hypothetical protein
VSYGSFAALCGCSGKAIKEKDKGDELRRLYVSEEKCVKSARVSNSAML